MFNHNIYTDHKLFQWIQPTLPASLSMSAILDTKTEGAATHQPGTFGEDKLEDTKSFFYLMLVVL